MDKPLTQAMEASHNLKLEHAMCLSFVLCIILLNQLLAIWGSLQCTKLKVNLCSMLSSNLCIIVNTHNTTLL